MRILYLNPNATEAMTESVVSVARAAVPGVDVLGWTNHDGPPAIQGAEDGAAAVRGLMALLPEARAARADAIVIACFDDTGLATLRAAAHCPVVGIGQAAMSLAALQGDRFGIVTTLDVSVPVIAANVEAYGHGKACVGAGAVVLGCAGMSRLRESLAGRSRVPLVDGVRASAHLACALA